MTYGRFQPLSQEVLQKLAITPVKETGVLTELFQMEIIDEGLTDTIFNFPYFQKISSGTLNPNKYGSLIVLDSFYCFNAVESLYIAANESEDTLLKPLLIDLYRGYKEYAATFPNEWHLNYDANVGDSEILPAVVVPSETMKGYVAYERELAESSDILALVVMFTCYYLWPVLYNKMPKPLDTNVYGEWITSNQDGETAAIVDKYVTKWAEENEDAWNAIVDIVPSIFYNCTLYEANLFYAAEPPSTLSMKEYLKLK